MNYADIKYCDVANGKGVRVSLFVSGCTHHCKGCFNEETWNFHYGKPFTEETEKQVLDYLDKSYIAGLSLLGGEPFEHVNQQDFEKDILGRMAEQWEETKEMLSYIDVLVDGEFKEALKSPSLQFKGSSNQRIIEVQPSLKEGHIVLWEPKEYVHVEVREN